MWPMGWLRPLRWLGLLLGAWLVLGSSQPASAAKHIEARIERDGEVVLKTSMTASDTEDRAVTWQRLETAPFHVVGKLPRPEGGSQQTTLTGRVAVVLVWKADEPPVSSASVEELDLVRVPGAEDRWQLPRAEVARTARAAGLDLPKRPWPAAAVGAAAVTGAVVLGAGVWLLARRCRERAPSGDL